MSKLSRFVQTSNARIVGLFSSFMFVQFIVLRLANQAGRGYLPEEKQEQVYLFIQIIFIGGYLLHSFIYSFLASKASLIKILSFSAFSLCLAGYFYMIFSSPSSLAYLIISGITVFILGFVGNMTYLRISDYITDEKHAGLFIGIGYSLALALQFVFQLRWNNKIALVILAVSFPIMLFYIFSKGSGKENDCVNVKSNVKLSALVYYLLITVALLFFTAYYNGYIHHLQISTGYTEYNVYTWPRLLMIPTVITLGFVSDLRGGRYLPVITLCVTVLALLNTSLLGQNTYLLNMCLYYLSLAAVIVYYHVTFLRIAPLTRRPALWAGMGRLIDSVVVIITFGLKISSLSQSAVLTVNIIALATVIIMMALNGSLNLSKRKEELQTDETKTTDERFLEVKNRFHITPSEMKVLFELVNTDDKQEVIATRLGISVSTLRHHITSIYRKTDVQTRLALSNLIYGK